MSLELTGKILFVFSDPGGAKPCLSLIEENKLTGAVAVSDKTHKFYNDFNIPVTIVKHDFEKLIDAINPSLIFTGTSYTSNIERRFIEIALHKKILCYSFVDHWTSMTKRFKNSLGQMVLPDQIWVIDERAKQLAIKEGIDETKIVITGNPYHSRLKRWVPSISREKFFKIIGVKNGNKKILLFAPDPLSNVDGKNEYGYDELSATMLLVELFSLHKEELKDWIVLVKAHPNQDSEKLKSIISGHSSFSMLSADIDTNTTIYYADVVMGFFSSILIEASIMNKLIFRFLDGEIKYDPIAELNLGRVVNQNSIINELTKISEWN